MFFLCGFNLFVWLLPYISPLIMLCFILMLAPYLTQLFTTIAKISINQAMVHYQALDPLTQVTGSSRLLMTPPHYQIKSGDAT